MLVIVFAISLALVNCSAAAKLPDDIGEESGDFDMGINPFKQQPSDSNEEKSNEEDVTKVFVEYQQRQRQLDQNHPTSKSTKLPPRPTSPPPPPPPPPPQPKGKQRKADLNDDVNDFVDLIPKAEVKAKIEEYYRNDVDVQHVFEYMHGKEFLELRKNILELSDVKDAFQYLNKNGLNVKSVIRKLDHRLGISKIRTTQSSSNPQAQFGTNTTIGGLNGLLEDVLALLPQDEIFMLFFEKLDSSPRFGAFVQCIGDPNFHRKYTTLWKSKDLHSASAQLKKHKIDIIKIIQIIQSFFIFGTF